MDSKMISQKLDRQFVFEGVKLIIQLNDQNPGCDQCMRFLDYYSRFALQSGDKELLLLVNIVIIGEIRKNLEGKNESFKSTNYPFAVKALSEIRSIRKKDVMEQKGLLK